MLYTGRAWGGLGVMSNLIIWDANRKFLVRLLGNCLGIALDACSWGWLRRGAGLGVDWFRRGLVEAWGWVRRGLV